MTLFAHTLPIPQVVQLWTYLFTQKVEYLFFITVAVLSQLKERLLGMDLNSTLQLINNIAGLVEIPTVIREATHMMEKCPQSFIVGDFVLDVAAQVKTNEALAHNEYFARRWWELECLDYRDDLALCLISTEDLVERLKTTERILLDVRPFSKYTDCHMKGSFNMNQQIVARYVEEVRAKEFQMTCRDMQPEGTQAPAQLSDWDRRIVQVYLDFLKAYQENYPDSFIVLIGDHEDKGNAFGVNIIMQSEQPNLIRNVCILKGGIDAVKVEHPELLRKRSGQQKEEQMIQQYEKFVKNSKNKTKTPNGTNQEDLLQL